MISQTSNKKSSPGRKVLHFIFRFGLALFVLLFKAAVAIITLIIKLFVALFDRQENEGKKDDAHGGSTGEFRQAIGFERNGPFKNGVPTKNDK